jgi:hypothetical protein
MRLRGLVGKFCVETEGSLRNFFRNLKAEDIETFFDRLEDAHHGKIKAHSALSNY